MSLNDEQLDRLDKAIAGWLGTPFRANGCAQGKGVSCQKLVAALYREIGLIDVDPPEVAMDHHMQSRESLAEPYIDALGRFKRVESAEAGDLLGFRIGRVVHHMGIALRNRQFVHCVRGCGVVISSLDDPTWAKRLAVVWRFNSV